MSLYLLQLTTFILLIVQSYSELTEINIFSRTPNHVMHKDFYPKSAWIQKPMQLLVGEANSKYKFNITCFRGLISYNNSAYFDGFITNTSIPLPHLHGEMIYNKVSKQTYITKYKGRWYYGQWFGHGTITVIKPFDINSIKHLLPIVNKSLNTGKLEIQILRKNNTCKSDGERVLSEIILLTILCTITIMEPLAALFGHILAFTLIHFC